MRYRLTWLTIDYRFFLSMVCHSRKYYPLVPANQAHFLGKCALWCAGSNPCRLHYRDWEQS